MKLMHIVMVLASICVIISAGCTEQDIEEYKSAHPEIVQDVPRYPSTPTTTPTTIEVIPTEQILSTQTTEPTVLANETVNITPTETVLTPTETITPTETVTPTETETPMPTETINETPTVTSTPMPTSTIISIESQPPVTTEATPSPSPTPELSYIEQVRLINPVFGTWKLDPNVFISDGGSDFGVPAGQHPATGYVCGNGGLWIKVISNSSPEGYTRMAYDTQWQIIESTPQKTVYSMYLTLSGGTTPVSYYTEHRNEHLTIVAEHRNSEDKVYFMFAGNELSMSRV